MYGSENIEKSKGSLPILRPGRKTGSPSSSSSIFLRGSEKENNRQPCHFLQKSGCNYRTKPRTKSKSKGELDCSWKGKKCHESKEETSHPIANHVTF